jgi:hypothetical protein
MDELEIVARKMAAKKMGLIKDPDGLRLPDDIWKQMEAAAEKLLYRQAADAWLDTLSNGESDNGK